jgi:hypothetical protein
MSGGYTSVVPHPSDPPAGHEAGDRDDPTGRRPAAPKHAGDISRFDGYMTGGRSRLEPQRRARPSVVVCAWCEVNGLGQGAARDPASGEWQTVSHDFVREAKRLGRASHGICPTCRPLVLEDWGLSDP